MTSILNNEALLVTVLYYTDHKNGPRLYRGENLTWMSHSVPSGTCSKQRQVCNCQSQRVMQGTAQCYRDQYQQQQMKHGVMPCTVKEKKPEGFMLPTFSRRASFHHIMATSWSRKFNSSNNKRSDLMFKWTSGLPSTPTYNSWTPWIYKWRSLREKKNPWEGGGTASLDYLLVSSTRKHFLITEWSFACLLRNKSH